MVKASNTVKPPLWAPGINWSHPQAKGLVFAAPMVGDHATTIYDRSMGRRHLTTVNTPVYTASAKGPCWAFTAASSQYAANDVSCPIEAYPFTMACWFKANDAATLYALMWMGNKNTSVYFCSLQLGGSQAGDPVRAYSNTYGGTAGTATTSSGFLADTWHHACGVWGGVSERHAYIDGGNKGSDTTTAGAMIGHNSIALGRLHDSTPGFYFDGSIVLACVWNRALGDAEVREHYLDPWAIFTPPK